MPILLILSLLSLAFAKAFTTYRTDGFTYNILNNTFPSNISVHLHAARLLSDHSLAAAGTVLYPPGFAKAALISNGPGFSVPEDTTLPRLSSLVIRIYANGTVAWAIRTALVKTATTVTLAVDDSDNIYIAGATTGILENGVSSGEAPFMAKFDKDGESSILVTHKTVGQYYLSLIWHKSQPNELLAASYAPASHDVFSGINNAPMKGGLVGVRVEAQTLSILASNPISRTEDPATGDLVFDKFWHMCSSASGEVVYFGVRRQTMVSYLSSFTPSILAMSAGNLSVSKVRSLPKDLQRSMKVTVSPHGLYVAYISRTTNREALVVQKLSSMLEDDLWRNGNDANFKQTFEPDKLYFRQVTSSVTDVIVDSNYTVHVLLHTSEIINRSDPLLEQHRELSNGRPAILEIAADQTVFRIEQSTTLEKWTPSALLLGEKELFILGTDEGLDGTGQSASTVNPHPLLTKLELKAIPVSSFGSPSPTAHARPIQGNNRDDACIGASSKFDGRKVRDLIMERHDLRLQIHPQWKIMGFLMTPNAIDMLCVEWHNMTVGSSLCATPFHVLRWHGKLVYMREMCSKIKTCSQQRDEPLNFKGPCGADLKAHDHLNVTMHSATSSKMNAEYVASAECVARAKSPLRWLALTI